LVFGSEGGGVDKEILDIAKKRLKIKISEEVESLNVAIAAGIILEKF
jgi:tRNA G18 (ribose-2'-O)-methylase SpoU